MIPIRWNLFTLGKRRASFYSAQPTALKAIETFVGGELVWSRSDQTGEYGFQPVVAHKATPYQAIYRVVVKNGSGYRETFRTTAEHPFWLKDQGWLKASLLQAGMMLVDHTGQPLMVVSQAEEGELDTVFNIQVAEFQTYHVGELGVWVHNADCCLVSNNDANPIGYLAKDVPSACQGMRSGGGHAMRHLIDEGLIPNAGSLQSRAKSFEDITAPILVAPSSTFDWKIGVTQSKAFVGNVDGKTGP